MNEYYNVSFVFDDIFYLQFMQLAIVLYKVRRNNQWSLQINLNIFFWFFIYFLFLYLFEISWYSQDKCIYWELPSSSVLDHNIIFRCPKGLIATFLKFANMQKLADFCKWLEIWKAHIDSNMFLPFHAKNQTHFQVSERTYSHFIEICKDTKISWFLKLAGNLKSSYQFKYVSTQPCQKSASYSGVRKDL